MKCVKSQRNILKVRVLQTGVHLYHLIYIECGSKLFVLNALYSVGN